RSSETKSSMNQIRCNRNKQSHITYLRIVSHSQNRIVNHFRPRTHATSLHEIKQRLKATPGKMMDQRCIPKQKAATTEICVLHSQWFPLVSTQDERNIADTLPR